jgi:predicted dehydrogenase
MVKIGIIGIGYWGPKLARNFDSLPDSELAWACDLDPARLAHVQAHYPRVRVTRNYRDLLDSDVDAVVISTPATTHHFLAMEALRADKHILVEKPLAACVEQAADIAVEAKQRHRVLLVGHTFVYNAAVTAIKEIIASGSLGEIYHINGMRVNLGLFQPDINVVWDLAPHDVSILTYVMGMPPESASARGGVCVQHEKGLHDVAYLSFLFPNGVMADIQVSWLDPCKIRRYTVVGSSKMLVYDDIAPVDKLVIYDKGVNVQPPYSDTAEEFHLSYHIGEVVPYPLQWVEPLQAECQDFLDCIIKGQEPRSNGRMGVQVVRALESAQHSLLNGGNREIIGESRGFCAHRTRRAIEPPCQERCLRQVAWL